MSVVDALLAESMSPAVAAEVFTVWLLPHPQAPLDRPGMQPVQGSYVRVGEYASEAEGRRAMETARRSATEARDNKQPTTAPLFLVRGREMRWDTFTGRPAREALVMTISFA